MKAASVRTDLKTLFLVVPEGCSDWVRNKQPPTPIPALVLGQAAHPEGRAGSSACGSTSSLCPWLPGLSVQGRQLSGQALLFSSHCLCIFLEGFLCSPWLPFYCHFCPKCPVYSLSISLQLSLEETLAAGDFPATFTCWGLLLIWHLTPHITQQGLNRTSILQKTYSLFPMKSVKGIRRGQICCGKIWWPCIPFFSSRS